MRADLERLRKPTARMLEIVFDKYYRACHATNPPQKEIEINEANINWKALVMSLPPPQNKSVLGAGIRKMFLAEAECVYHGVYRFHVQRLDGSRAMFDFRDAFDDSYHNYKDKSFVHDVELALRAGVLPQLIQYKEMLAKDNQMELVCHVSGIALPWERAVVQHFPVTFMQLVDMFLNENQLKMDQIKLDFDEDHGYRVKDQDLLDKWRIFHRSQAHYRIISTDEATDQPHL